MAALDWENSRRKLDSKSSAVSPDTKASQAWISMVTEVQNYYLCHSPKSNSVISYAALANELL